MADIQTTCDSHGKVRMAATEIVIDDDGTVYRFTCPKGGEAVSKRYNTEIRRLLRSGGVHTIDEVVASAKVTLDSDDEIWSGIEIPESES